MKFTTVWAKGLIFPDAGLGVAGRVLCLTHTVMPRFYILLGKLINYYNKKSTDLKSALHLEDFQKMYP